MNFDITGDMAQLYHDQDKCPVLHLTLTGIIVHDCTRLTSTFLYFCILIFRFRLEQQRFAEMFCSFTELKLCIRNSLLVLLRYWFLIFLPKTANMKESSQN